MGSVRNRVNKVTIRINGSLLGLSLAPRGAGSSPARDNPVYCVETGVNRSFSRR